jgi:hypothetical protein
LRENDCFRSRGAGSALSAEPRDSVDVAEGKSVGYRGGTGLFARGLRFVRDLLGRRGVGKSVLRGELLPESLSERTFSLPLRVILEIMRCRRPVFLGVRSELADGEVTGGSGGPSARKSISSLAFADMPLWVGWLFSFSGSSPSSEPPMMSSRSSDSRFLATVRVRGGCDELKSDT